MTYGCGGSSPGEASTARSGATGQGQVSAQSGQAKPNIVFIVTDDMDMASLPYMPKLQAFVANVGASFQNSFATDPVCCPSRASMLRGQYAHNHGVWTNGRGNNTCFADFKDHGNEESTFATWLKAAGYRTGLFGKYLNRYPQTPTLLVDTYVAPGWDEWFVIFNADYNSDSYFNYFANDNKKVVTYGRRADEYETDVLAGKAVDFIKRGSDGKPFFLWVTTTAPHNDPVPAPRHENAMADKHAPRTPNFNLADISSKPAWYRANTPLLTASDVSDLDWVFRKKLETLQAVDDLVQNVVDALYANNMLGSTYIFFTSDNGYMNGNHRFVSGKDAPYEESIRVPLLVRGPGIPLGTTLPHTVGSIDFAPTFAELAQTSPAAFVDGRSLMPLLTGSAASASWRQDILLEHEPADVNGLPAWFAVRNNQEKYVVYPANAEEEYYNLVDDPYETASKHRAMDPAKKTQLKTRLTQLQACAAASCRQ